MNTPPANGNGAVPQTASAKTFPTLGSVVGSLLGSVLANKAHLDPLSAGTVIAGLTAFTTGLFHWLGQKIGVPL